MKYSLFFIALALGCAQSTTTSYSTGVNGDRSTNFTTVESGGQRTQITQSINGRQVPMEQTETRVLSQSPNSRVTEQITRRFDPNGGVAATERTVTEEQKTSNGSHVHATLYRSDVNGHMQEFERRDIDSASSGASASKQTEIARPDMSGSFQTVEKRTESTETSGDNTHTDETTYRRTESGAFAAATRDVSDAKKQGSQMVTTKAHYEPLDPSRQQMQLVGQSVTSTVTKADGSAVSEVSLYGNTAGDGRVHDRDGKLHLREQQTIEVVAGAGGSLTDTVTAQRPSVSDPERMGPARKVSEVTCTGKCSLSNFGFMH